MRVTKIVVMAVLLLATASAQFKQTAEARPSVSESLVRPDNGGLLFGWFDPSRLTMHHSYSLSFMSFGGRGLSVGMYTNSLNYKFSDPLELQVDVSLMHSPFNSFGNKNDFTGVFLNRAQLNYRPSENMLLQIQYRQLPPMYWWGNPRSSGFFEATSRTDGGEY